MKSLLTLILFMISFAAEAAFFCAKAQSSRFDDSALQTRIEALIKAQIRLEQKDFGSQSEFEMALAYFQNETAKLHQAVPGFVTRYKQKFLELKDQVLDQQTAVQRQKTNAEQTRREVVRNVRAISPIEVREIQHDHLVNTVNFSRDGKFLVTVYGNNKPGIIDAATGQILREIWHSDSVSSANFSPDGKLIVTGSYDKNARIVEVATGKILHQIQHGDWVVSADFSPDGKLIVTGSLDGKARIIDVATGKMLRKIEQGNPVTSVSFSPDGKLIVTAAEKNARIIDVGTGQTLHKILHGGDVTSTNFSSNGKLIVTGSTDSHARIIDVATGEILHSILHMQTVEYRDVVRSASFSPDDKWIVTTGERKTRIIDVAIGNIIHQIDHEQRINISSFSPDGEFIVVTSSVDRKTKFFQLYRAIGD